LVNIVILRLCNYDKSPDHVESAGKFTLKEKDVIIIFSKLKTRSADYKDIKKTNPTDQFQISRLGSSIELKELLLLQEELIPSTVG
jgi:hypothetical protein